VPGVLAYFTEGWWLMGMGMNYTQRVGLDGGVRSLVLFVRSRSDVEAILPASREEA
jgi:hypothetical protein